MLKREDVLRAPACACPMNLHVYVWRLCACPHRDFLRPRDCLMVLIGKCDLPRFEMANLDTRSLGGGSRDGRQMAREDHSWAWPPNLGTLGSHCPSSNGLEDLGSPTSPELTQVS